MPRYEYRNLQPTPEAQKSFLQWIERLDSEFTNKDPEHRSRIVRDTLHEIYLNQPTDEHGVLLSFREYEDKCARYDKEVEQQIKESLDHMPDLGAELDKKVDAMIAALLKQPPQNGDSLRWWCIYPCDDRLSRIGGQCERSSAARWRDIQ